MPKYPPTRRDDFIETLHGQTLPDPYRWLEDDNSPETTAWVAAQNELTFSYLEGIPERAEIRSRLADLWDYEKFGVPFEKGGRFFFTRNDGLQNQAPLYVLDTLEGQPRLLLDPNSLSSDGTVAFGAIAVSEDGKYLAYALSNAGSDWQEWHVRDVSSGQDLPDRIQWSKFSEATWMPDGSGFYYARYDAPDESTAYKDANYYQKLYFHRLGTPQSQDALVYERPDHKEWGFGAVLSDDGRYLIIGVWKGTHVENAIFYQDLRTPGAPVVELFKDFDATYDFLGNDGQRFYFFTNHSAPRARVIAVDLANPAPAAWTDLIPQGEDALERASIVGQRLFCTYLHDAHSQVKVYDLQGSFLHELAQPGLGTVMGFAGGRHAAHTFFLYTSFNTPSVIYRYALADGQVSEFRRPTLRFNPQDYVTEQVFYTSKDGTRVPMFINYKRGMVKNGQNRTLLYGYGGFNIALTPAFSPAFLTWMELGGIFAQANLRGGSEYGQDWHEGGMKLCKQNVFDDFIAAAEYLIAENYTCTPKLAIHGRSNGGLLAGACLTQRPDLFGAVIPTVGVLDMLRFHKFTIGWAWVSDYGSPEDPAEFAYLKGYSPYHNVRQGTVYPPTLVTTGDHDDRVFPGHSFKFAAALQAAQAGPAPLLIRIDVRAGHGAGKPTAKLIDEWADIFAFLVGALP